MTTRFADIGVNLTDRRFDADRDQALDRARQAGVCLQLLTGTSVAESRDALALAASHADLFATAGIHPHHASEFNTTSCSELRELASHPAVLCIGECGLDFNRDFSPRPAQEAAFSSQLELAAELQLPVFLHQRDAHDRFIGILREYRDALPAAVVHCFTDDRRALFESLDLDCHIGITGWICDERRGQSLQALVPHIPANRLLLETDSPWLLPRDYPGKNRLKGRNEPALLPWIAESVAQLRGEEPESLAAQVWRNTLGFLGLPAQFTGQAED